MAFKGFNSILFDFSSIIDIELSMIKYLINEYKDSGIFNFDSINRMTVNEIHLMRAKGIENISKSILTDKSIKDRYEEFYTELFKRDKKEILSEEYAIVPDIKALINGYRAAGDGVIKTAIRCTDSIEADCIRNILPNSTIIISSRQDTDMSKYGRLIVGNWKDALQYKLEEPKSILVLDYRENFLQEDISMLNPELIVLLGDIHDIEVISAYRDDSNIEIEG